MAATYVLYNILSISPSYYILRYTVLYSTPEVHRYLDRNGGKGKGKEGGNERGRGGGGRKGQGEDNGKGKGAEGEEEEGGGEED